MDQLKQYIVSLIRKNHYIKIFCAFVFLSFIRLINLVRRNKISASHITSYVFDGFFRLIRPMQIRAEISRLLPKIQELSPEVILEIGTARGGTLFLFSQLASSKAIIISIDLPHGSFGGGYPKWKVPIFKSFARYKQKIFLLRSDSHSEETLMLVKTILKGKGLDILFIDGDHTYEGVKLDYSMYSPLVRKGGLIALHDIAKHPPELGCEVHKFWLELSRKVSHLEIIDNPNQGWAGIGVIFKT